MGIDFLEYYGEKETDRIMLKVKDSDACVFVKMSFRAI